MKILILSFYYTPDLCAGSFRTGEFVAQLQKKILKNDSIDIITTLPQRYSTFKVEAKTIEKRENVCIKRIKTINHNSGVLFQSIAFAKYFFFSLITVLFKKYDRVYATSSRLFTGFLGAIISSIKGIPLYIDIRDIFVDTVKSVFPEKKHLILLKCIERIEKFTVNKAVKINFVSEGFVEYFNNYPDIKYSLFTNGISDIFYSFDFYKKYNSKKIIITYAGNIGEGQGLDRIVPQIALFLGERYEIWIIGDGGKRKNLELKIINNNIKNVKIINPVKQNELLIYYKNSDYLFLHLNDHAAFNKVLPSKIFEYAATDKSIIAGVTGFPFDFINKNLDDVILFSPCNIDEFKANFSEIADKRNNTNRNEFILKYKRSDIMEKMALDFLNSTKK